MKIQPNVKVFSTKAIDVLFDVSHAELSRNAGGPALFIADQLHRQNIKFELFCNEVVQVDIMLTARGEFGTVSTLPKPHYIEKVHRDDWIVVSTIVDEWQFKTFNTDARLFIDTQGFVRDGTNFGGKKQWHIPPDIFSHIDCLKGTREEIAYLDASLVEKMKQKILVITDGGKGIEVHSGGHMQVIPVVALENLANTLGAGDTFFAGFIAEMLRVEDAFKAATFASEQTSHFLENKLKTNLMYSIGPGYGD
jgi:hypothetical protein